jgi:uncharacterized protein
LVDLNFEKPGNYHYIRSLSTQGIQLGEQVYACPILVSAEALDANWPPASMAQLQERHLESIFGMAPEVVLLGTGKQQVFLPPRMMMLFFERGVGIEVMTTDAACRTFNVLVSEGRNVVAALMPT